MGEHGACGVNVASHDVQSDVVVFQEIVVLVKVDGSEIFYFLFMIKCVMYILQKRNIPSKQHQEHQEE